MKNYQPIQLRAFPVRIRDERTKEVKEDTIILNKAQLQAAQVVGQSSKELIERIYNREGYTVLEIGKATKREVMLDFDELFWGTEDE